MPTIIGMWYVNDQSLGNSAGSNRISLWIPFGWKDKKQNHCLSAVRGFYGSVAHFPHLLNRGSYGATLWGMVNICKEFITLLGTS